MELCSGGKILLVDDDIDSSILLGGLLRRFGHNVVKAGSGAAALRLLNRTFDLVLCDVMMPKVNGFELVRKIRADLETQQIPIIMMTALSEGDLRLKAIEAGANDYIGKPVDIVELKVRVASMLRQKAQQDEITRFQAELGSLVEHKTLDLRRVLSDLEKAQQEVVMHLSAAAEYKDEETACHIKRMSRYSALIAEKLGLDREEVSLIRTSSPMHDVGKIGIPDLILFKPGKLNEAEMEVMKAHTTIGGNILGAGNSDYLNMGTIIALSHHEKWDGSGYPSGVAGEDIPLPGRICAVADVFDALTSRRPYKEAFSLETSVEIMREGRGAHFDPQVLDVFLENLDAVADIREQFKDGFFSQTERVDACGKGSGPAVLPLKRTPTE